MTISIEHLTVDLDGQIWLDIDYRLEPKGDGFAVMFDIDDDEPYQIGLASDAHEAVAMAFEHQANLMMPSSVTKYLVGAHKFGNLSGPGIEERYDDRISAMMAFHDLVAKFAEDGGLIVSADRDGDKWHYEMVAGGERWALQAFPVSMSN
jgi:hypothetical protein